MHLTDAVAAKGERLGVLSERGLAGVEDVPPVVQRSGVAVRHHHLTQRGPIADRPDPAGGGIVVGDLVQHQTIDRMNRDPHRPALPSQLAALERETGAIGLGDDERREVLPQGTDAGIVSAHPTGVGRYGCCTAVADLDHLPRRTVGDHQQPLDRPSPRRVAVVLADEQDRSAETASEMIDLLPEVGRRPRLDDDGVEIGDAALAQRLLDTGIAEDGRSRLQPLDGQDRSVQPGLRFGLLDGSLAQVDDALEGDTSRPVDAHRHGPARHRPVGCPRQHVALGRFLERHPRHDRLLADPAAVEQEPDDGADLVHRQRLERMRRSSRLGVNHLATLRPVAASARSCRTTRCTPCPDPGPDDPRADGAAEPPAPSITYRLWSSPTHLGERDAAHRNHRGAGCDEDRDCGLDGAVDIECAPFAFSVAARRTAAHCQTAPSNRTCPPSSEGVT